ncbi:hypothetical protein AO498_12795 [Algoriphagus sanaruensis]|uniref:Uncharacterized protein n=1 Tax=Algoriphagus sanaruensis TaxID=1727163 RepID=A0A142EQB2_9BACT|nr:hypothetical protein AO498_12795 [Algoriphagus sanaruensis]
MHQNPKLLWFGGRKSEDRRPKLTKTELRAEFHHSVGPTGKIVDIHKIFYPIFISLKTVLDLDVANPDLYLLTIMENTNRNIEFLATAQHSHMLHYFHHSS